MVGRLRRKPDRPEAGDPQRGNLGVGIPPGNLLCQRPERCVGRGRRDGQAVDDRGAVADRIDGPWRLINGTGIVAANPAEEPTQAYSWLVLPDASVTSFVDQWGRSDGAGQFAGTFAPFEKLILDGDAARLATR